MDNTLFRQNGFAVVQEFLDRAQITALLMEFENFHNGNVRNLLQVSSSVKRLAYSPELQMLARSVLGEAALPVKATLFDKTAGKNWKVPPHQDVTIVVSDRVDTDGFGPWTVKEGQHNVQPPSEVLVGMAAFRIHLDDCGEDNGALKVWPGSHLHGKLGDARIQEWIDSHAAVTCPVAAGGVLIMHPLVIHASSAAVDPSHRRVVHIDFASCALPNGLSWATT